MVQIDKCLSFITTNKIKFIDFRFTDIKGQEQHITIPSTQIDDQLLKNGKFFDGSSMIGWKNVHESDMILMPDLNTLIIDPFYQDNTVIIRCDIVDPHNINKNYDRDPRSIAKNAEKYLINSGIAEYSIFGPELEFFLFDNIRYHTSMSGCRLSIDDIESTWNNNKFYKNGNKGHRPKIKGGYASISPIDSSHNLRSSMALIMENMGLIVEAHHHEVATSGQNEIATKFNTLTKKADETQIFKYIVHNVAKNFGKTATFMPKPIIHDNGSGMHCHISLYKNNTNLFSGNKYANLSETALFFIGGILKHAKSLNAITNPTTNSYKRLIPGYEAPIMLTYSACNRSSAIRIPLTTTNKNNSCRLEIRFPDPSANPYLAFSALLMAGIDGIIKKIHPGQPIKKNLYTIPKSEQKNIPQMSQSLKEALQSLNEDYEFLTSNNVFTSDFIESYVSLLQKESDLVNSMPHPVEFELYYSI